MDGDFTADEAQAWFLLKQDSAGWRNDFQKLKKEKKERASQLQWKAFPPSQVPQPLLW